MISSTTSGGSSTRMRTTRHSSRRHQRTSHDRFAGDSCGSPPRRHCARSRSGSGCSWGSARSRRRTAPCPGGTTHPDRDRRRLARRTGRVVAHRSRRGREGRARVPYAPERSTPPRSRPPNTSSRSSGKSFLEPSAEITIPSYWMVMGHRRSPGRADRGALEDGRTVVADLVPLPAGILGSNKAFIALDLTDDPSSLAPPEGTIVALDASGAELDRQDLALPGSPDGRPGGAEGSLRNAFVAALTYYDGRSDVRRVHAGRRGVHRTEPDLQHRHRGRHR